MLTKTQLRELYRQPSERSQQKQISELEEQSKLFISNSPFMLVSTYGNDGRCDCSPRGGEAGFVRVLNGSQIAIPDFLGNNRLDSLENIIETQQIGCLFLIPGISETLRLNGTASVCNDPEIIEQFSVPDRVKTYILIDITEVYIHCGKSLIRSAIWDSSTQTNPKEFPSLGKFLNAHVGKTVMTESHSEIDVLYQQTMIEQDSTE